MPRSNAEKANRWSLLFSRYAANGEIEQNIEAAYFPGIVEKIPESLLRNTEIIKNYAHRLESLRENHLKRLYDRSSTDLKSFPNKRTSGGNWLETKALTQQEIANILGTSNVAIHKKEAGAVSIDRFDLCCFSLIYGVTPHYLLGLVPENEFFTYLVSASAIAEFQKRSTDDEYFLLNFPVFVADRSARKIKIPTKFTESSVEFKSKILVYISCQQEELIDAIFSILDHKIEEIRMTLEDFSRLFCVEDRTAQQLWKSFSTEELQSRRNKFFALMEYSDLKTLLQLKERLVLLALRDYETWELLGRVIFALL